jgi:hypothetical protein
MTEKLRNTGGMLFDIYQDDLHLLPIVKSMFAEINENPSKEFPSIGKSDRQMLIYVSLMYDKHSPLRKETIVNRKSIAIQQSGITSETTRDNWCNLNDKRLIMMVHNYLRYQNDKEWASLCTSEEVYWDLQEKILSHKTDKDGDVLKDVDLKIKLTQKMSELMDTVAKFQDMVFNDNKEKMDEIINFYPEDYVEALEKKQKERIL